MPHKSTLRFVIIPAKAREYVFTGVGLSVCVCVSVCLSVTTITKKIVDGFAPNVMRRLGEREDQVHVSLRSVKGCGSYGQKKLRKPAIVYKIAPSGNTKLAGRKIVGVAVASVAKCWRQKRFRGDLYSFIVLSI